MNTNKQQRTSWPAAARWWPAIALAFGLASGLRGQVQAQGAVLSLRLVPELTISGPVGSTNQVQYVNAFGDTNHWLALTNLVLTTSPMVWYDASSPLGSQRFYRTITVPPVIELG